MSSVPDSNSQNIINSIPSKQSKKRKRRNKNKNKNKQSASKKKIFKYKSVNNSAFKLSKLMFTMSSWAEHFTFAATWQLKHQMAYWKAKAKSLEYENSVLHDIIRKNQYVNRGENSSTTCKISGSVVDKENHEDEEEINVNERHSPIREGKLGEWQDAGSTNSQTMLVDMQSESEEEEDSSDDNQDLEVSEEFIQFLMINAKHKEELRLEREQQKTEQEQAELEEREAQLRARRHYGLSAQDLYGERWQKTAALEMSMKCDYMADIDKNTPAFWPVIPFNFNSHYSLSNQNF
ncbi:gem-associated protein 8-like [Cydia amplana]|uniref:gem-associated protein 8-like n=1 Tax=Cydia amplana TaxID=1869771 RepID=UPI002FE5A45D